MSGETNLEILLRSMQPTLQAGEYVFCTINAQSNPVDFDAKLDAKLNINFNINFNTDLNANRNAELKPIGLFREAEGLTLILPRQQADAAALPYTMVFCLITLAVHSSLEAVGFLAAITRQLAAHQISVNPVSAYYHDHLFVPVSQAEQAIQLLQELRECVNGSPSRLESLELIKNPAAST